MHAEMSGSVIVMGRVGSSFAYGIKEDYNYKKKKLQKIIDWIKLNIIL